MIRRENSGGSASTPFAAVIFSTLTKIRFAPLSRMFMAISLLRKSRGRALWKNGSSTLTSASSPPASRRKAGSSSTSRS